MKSYNSITSCPIIVFDEVLRTGNHNLVGGAESWSRLYNEYIEEFGISEQYKSYIQAKCEECVHEIDAALEGNMIAKTLATLSRLEAEAIEEKSKERNMSLFEQAAYLSKKMGFRIDPKEVTVAEFYNYLKIR